LAAELTELYPAVAPKLADLVARVAANDRDIEFRNNYNLPKGAERLLTAELVARGLPGWGLAISHTALEVRGPLTLPGPAFEFRGCNIGKRRPGPERHLFENRCGG
jgi:hypothetical protein